MSQSNDLLEALDNLAASVTQAALDGAYSDFRLQLMRAHQALTTQAWWIRRNPDVVDGAAADQVRNAIQTCKRADRALQSADTHNKRSKAVSLTFEAIAAVNAIMPEEASAFI